MTFDLIKTEKEQTTYKFSGEVITTKMKGHIFYAKGMPAFMILENGEIDMITPDGMHIYIDNKQACDDWIRQNFNPLFSFDL